MKRALITGADGFLGRHLVKGLLEDKWSVHAVVCPGRNALNKIQNNRLHIHVMSLDHVLDYTDDFPQDIDVMYHFAWNGVKAELRDDMNAQLANIDLSLKCMEFAAAVGIRKVILPGSTNEYWYDGKLLNREAAPSPGNAYGAVKTAVRYLCADYARRNSQQFIYTIIASIYAEDRRDNNVIHYTIEKLLNKEKPVLTGLEQTWDYVYIDDVVRALMLIGAKGKDRSVYAVGHGDNWALSKYIRIIHEKIDAALPLGIGELPYPGGQIPGGACMDLRDLKMDTGFEPQVSFAEGIAKVIDAVKKDM